MNSGRTVFAQLLDHLPSYEFQKCVTRYRGDYQQKTFSCWDQYLSMAFAQLTYRDSLRDIEACLRSMRQAVPHGISRQGGALHSRRCQRVTRLANLRRFCPGVDWNCATVVCP